MTFPQDVIDIVIEASRKQPNDVPAATKWAMSRIKSLDEWEDIAESLLSHAVMELVYDARHHANVANRKEAGEYGAPQKVNPAQSSALRNIARSVYGYYIAGVTLGSLLGNQLAAIADAEAAKSEGHAFNAKLCRRLDQLVPDDKTVRDALSEKKLRAIFRELGGGTKTAAA